jgi:membrane protein DedA with SNARE-associated domain
MASAYIENIFPPFPGDAVVLAGLYLAGKGDINYIGVLISAVSGGMAGAMTLYAIGFFKGRRFFETGKGKTLAKGGLSKMDRLFQKYGVTIILVSRFVAGIRSAIAISTGIARYSVVRMMVLTTISFLLWYAMLTGLMIYSKSNWRMIVDIVRQYNVVLVAVGVVILVIWIAGALWARGNSR